MNIIFRRLLLAIGFVSFSTIGAAAETFEPLSFPSDDPLRISPDARLNLANDGTLELWFAATSNTLENQCLLRIGDGDERGFAIRMHAKRKALFLHLRQGVLTIPFDFDDGEFHHVAVVVEGGQLNVRVDGQVPQEPGDGDETFDMGPRSMVIGDAGAAGADGVIGCSDPMPFQGYLSAFRLWNIGLSWDELDWTRGFLGRPRPEWGETSRAALLDNLIMHSVFSDTRTALYLSEPRLARRSYGLPEKGDRHLLQFDRLRLPGEYKDRKLTRIYALPGGRGIDEIRFEFTSEGTLPLILPPRVDWAPWDQQALNAQAARIQDSGFGRQVDMESEVREARKHQLGMIEAVPDVDRELGILGWVTQDLAPEERITGLALRHDSEVITALRFRTNQRLMPMIASKSSGTEIVTDRFPLFSRLKGLELFQHPNDPSGPNASFHPVRRLLGLSVLVEEIPRTDEQAQLLELTEKLWVADGACPPRINDELAFSRNHGRPNGLGGLHGVYTTPGVSRIILNPDTSELEVLTDTVNELPGRSAGRETCGAAQVGGPVLRDETFVRDANLHGNRLKSVGGPGGELILRDKGGMVEILRGGINDYRLIPAKGYRDIEKDRIAWGGTFALPHRPANLRSNFLGYDITELNPHNYLRSHGVKRAVFAYPADDSTDYQTTDNNLIIPQGMFYKGDLGGAERGHTVMVSGSEQRAHAYSVNLGFNLGFSFLGIGASYSANYTQARQTEDRNEREVVMSITRTAGTRYALVLDRANVKLDPAFRAAVLDLRDKFLVGAPVSESSILRNFGTHYPYAVTYGGMAFLETEYSRELVEHMTAKQMSFQQSTEASFSEMSGSSDCGCGGGGGEGGLSASLGASGGFDKSSSLARAAQKSDESRVFGTYGGSLSRGEGWSLSPGEEVPLFFDMRPLSELLSPIFFDDPLVWTELKPLLHKAIEDHLSAAAAFGKPKANAWYADPDAIKPLMDAQPAVWDHGYTGKLVQQ